MGTVWKVGDRVENQGKFGILSKVDSNVYSSTTGSPWCVIEIGNGFDAGSQGFFVKAGWKLAEDTTPP